MQTTIRDDFDLEKIADSGQCFRWEKVDKETFRIVALDDCLYVEHKKGREYAFDCEKEAFFDKWHPYFALDEDFSAIRQQIPKGKDPFLHAAAKSEKGIRILRQDPWETLISFIISQNRNIPAIKTSIELLSKAAGRKKKDLRGRVYFTFPTPKALLRLSEKELADCRLGYRTKYIQAAARAVADKTIDLNALKEVSCEEAVRELTKLYGVGEKVASCVALFGLHQLDAFPVDVWVKRILENEYKKGYPYKAYSPYNGVYQQYMFAYYRKKKA